MYDYHGAAIHLGFTNKEDLQNYLVANPNSLYKGKIIKQFTNDGNSFNFYSEEEFIEKKCNAFDDIVLLVNDTNNIYYEFGYQFICDNYASALDFDDYFHLNKLRANIPGKDSPNIEE